MDISTIVLLTKLSSNILQGISKFYFKDLPILNKTVDGIVDLSKEKGIDLLQTWEVKIEFDKLQKQLTENFLSILEKDQVQIEENEVTAVILKVSTLIERAELDAKKLVKIRFNSQILTQEILASQKNKRLFRISPSPF